jgi:16S rRNA processing protein RimM
MDKLKIGVIRGPQGIQGFVKVISYSGEFEHFRNLKDASLVRDGKSRIAKVESLEIKGDGVLIRFVGVETPEKAREFAGWEIEVERKDACPLDEGEYYVTDLCQCSVLYQGEIVGTVKSVCSGATDLLEIETLEKKDVLVPFIGKFVGKVDLGARTVELLEKWTLE